MNRAEIPVSNDRLMAYVDGHLSADDRRCLEAYLEANPEVRAQVEAYRLQNKALHDAFDGLLTEPIPERMRPPERPRHPFWLAAGFAATLAIGVGVGWYVRGQNTQPRSHTALVHQAAAAHAVYTPEVRHPVEVGANEEAHLVAWLSKRLGQKVKAPDLNAQGYKLVGGRLLPAIAGGGRPGPAAHFMYEESSGQRLTLYVRTQMGQATETAFRYSKEGAVDVFYWVDGDLGYALSGTIGREKMLELARIVYQDLSGR